MEDFKQLSQFIDALSRAEDTNSRNEKVQILDEIKGNIFLKQICRYVFNNLLTLGVTGEFLKLDEIQMTTPFKNDLEVYTGFENVLTQLSTRQITGFSARTLVTEFFQQLPDFSHRQWYLNFIDKKFVTGFSSGSIVKIYPQLKTLYDVQTAETWTPEMKIDFTKEKWISEFKIDGMRMSTVKNPNDIPVFLSRDSRPLPEENLNFLLPILKKAIDENYVIDGEIFADDWNSTISISKSLAPHPDASKLKYYIFDCVPQKDFMSGVCEIPLSERKKKLNELVNNNPRIVVLGGIEIQSTEHLNELLLASIEAGFEGLVIKKLDSPYVGKRKPTWLKVKQFFTEDFTICDVIPGSGKYKEKPTLEACKKAVIELNLQESAEDLFSQVSHYLGALVVETGDAKQCNVGSGFSDSQRIHLMYQHLTKGITGMLCEVTFQEKTKDFSLRFPVLYRLRTDRTN